MAADPLPPDVEGQGRVVRIRPLVRPAQARPRPARRRRVAGRSCPSGSGRGSAPPPVPRRPAARARHGSSVRRRAAARCAARSPARPRSWPAACRRAPPAGTARSASGCRRSRPARGRSAGTCRAGGWTSRAARRGRPARPACHARPEAREHRPTSPSGRRARHGGHRRPRSDRAIRARRRDCSRRKACARLSRPQEAGQLKSDRQATRRTKERTAESITPDHLKRIGPGLSVAQAVLILGRKSTTRRDHHLDRRAVGRDRAGAGGHRLRRRPGVRRHRHGGRRR